MTTKTKERFRFTATDFEKAVGQPIGAFFHNCHAASIALVRSDAFEVARVARGGCPSVFGQHSWVVLGVDCYYPKARVIDPTLWSYDKKVKGVWTGMARTRPHTPHGAGNIFNWGKPGSSGGEPLTLEADLSSRAREFLALLGPLDRKGWAQLAHAPVGNWPSSEIIAAMYDDPRLSALIPIDIVGMITDLNPGNLYLKS